MFLTVGFGSGCVEIDTLKTKISQYLDYLEKYSGREIFKRMGSLLTSYFFFLRIDFLVARELLESLIDSFMSRAQARAKTTQS